MERYFKQQEKISFSKEVAARYDASLEDYRARDYAIDQQAQRLRRAS
jgi:hypothetical protein